MDITLEQPVRARLITAEDQELPVPATLRYDSTDPFAVHVDFPPEVSSRVRPSPGPSAGPCWSRA